MPEQHKDSLSDYSSFADICEKYHGGNNESKSAHAKRQRSESAKRIREMVLGWFTNQGTVGECRDTCSRELNTPTMGTSSIETACGVLLCDGLLTRTMRRTVTRTGSTAEVLVAAQFAREGDIKPYKSRRCIITCPSCKHEFPIARGENNRDFRVVATKP
jgi:hypothetical protein